MPIPNISMLHAEKNTFSFILSNSLYKYKQNIGIFLSIN